MKYPDIDVSGWRRTWEEGGKSTAWAYPVPSPRARRPWWWWVAFGFYVSAVLTAFWVAYRALAGWPVDGVSLLSRVAG